MIRIGIARAAKLGDYEAAVRLAGAIPVVLDASICTPAMVARHVDGVLLAGGDDVWPPIYGQRPHPAFVAAEPGRDDYELALVRQAAEVDLPLLALCRGIQVVNVAYSGTLVQDIPSQRAGAIPHTAQGPGRALAHDIAVENGSLLDRLLRRRLGPGHTCAVNSRHHQAVDRLGAGLVATAVAPDGIIEALEDPVRRFCLGVQWHPEHSWQTGEFRELFEAFVQAAGRR